jgi:hypothetical protein
MLFMNKHEEIFSLILSTKKIMFKYIEVYIGSNGSTLTILKHFFKCIV